MKHLYYFNPFEFHFRSGSTLQEVRNFTHLGRLDNRAALFGTYVDEAGFAEVRRYIGDSRVTLLAQRGERRRVARLYASFLFKIARDRSPNKIIIGRHVKMTEVLLRLRGALGNPILVHELHERAFPYLAEHKPEERAELERQTQRVLQNVDGLFLTNYSQEQIVKQELEKIPPYTIVPHGVEVERFQAAVPPAADGNGNRRIVLTYAGHFVAWKNMDTIFGALALLEPHYTLRIAGGITSKTSDAASTEYIRAQTERFGVVGRVDYRGFVSPERLVPEVLDGSSALLLPLGDNFESRYFTCPIKLIEYLSTQIPVVAVDYPSVHLLTGEDSVFLAADTPEAFARAVREAIYSPEKAARVKRMNEVAREMTVEKRALRADAWYSELVKGRAGKR